MQYCNRNGNSSLFLPYADDNKRSPSRCTFSRYLFFYLAPKCATETAHYFFYSRHKKVKKKDRPEEADKVNQRREKLSARLHCVCCGRRRNKKGIGVACVLPLSWCVSTGQGETSRKRNSWPPAAARVGPVVVEAAAVEAAAAAAE